ncbi:MAG: hypothetical protein FD161_1473 [Limisphaerales bacterium]|nr:MAG: hypothetical protein FD161_1473 [Limisphaerales bacterium]KAG0509550.1 MAG: hypothetical protein E1N63_1392 [Limisphaerales bacterium]TXT52386.1 MAG: hypothetical protein FD140_873 [Limisphaerales bacterium]
MPAPTRRAFLAQSLAATAALAATRAAAQPAGFRLAAFSADVTVPAGHGMMGGAWLSKSVADPLFAKGIVLTGGEKPVVLVSVDWCEIRNAAFDRWRDVLAEAAGTDRARVLVSSTHVHDAPVADLEAERILKQHKCAGTVCDVAFHEVAVQRVAKALRDALKSASPVTQIGLGQARVEKIASNRRYLLPDGKVSYSRGSATRDALASAAGEDTTDPMLKTLSFWNGNTPLAALSNYAVHPMSYYRTGDVSADFPGLARRRRQEDLPNVAQVYFSGCSGNVTAGKYNTGARENRPVLAGRLYQAMAEAWRDTKKVPLERITFRSVPLTLEPRNEPDGFTVAGSTKLLAPDQKPFAQCLAAMNLSWRKRAATGQPIDVPAVDFGPAQFLLLPAEAYVEFQLHAQAVRPDSFVMVAGYGESAPGYIPIERAWEEKDGNLHDWCWVAPGSEARMKAAIEAALRK